jgi:hypothetical protein
MQKSFKGPTGVVHILIQKPTQRGGENTMELKIADTKKETIPTALGMADEKLTEITIAMAAHFMEATINHVKEHLKGKAHECRGQSKTQKLASFLVSKEFKALKWQPKTANDYFLLGFAFSWAIEKDEEAVKEAARTVGLGQKETKTIELGKGIKIEITR